MGDAKKAGRRGMIREIAAVTGMALFFAGCGRPADGMEFRRTDPEASLGTLEEPGFFAYTDEDNRLWLWEQGGEDPRLLTDKAFALEKMAEPEVFYWEEWEYWQEWDNMAGQWVWNHESALEGGVQKAPDGSVYFPQEMRWESFCMKRSAGEREEALRYANGETVDEYAGVRIFLYDLYRYSDGNGDGRNEKVAENVCYYQMDGQGNIWYCKADAAKGEDGAEEEAGTGLPLAECMLYRYDGKETLKIGEINGRRKEPFRVDAEGEYVLFFALDDGLYGCKPGEEADLLAEGLCRDIFYDWGVYTDTDMNRIIYTEKDAIRIKERKSGRDWELTGEGDILFAGLTGEKADRILTLRLEEGTAYSDWIERGKEEGEDEDTRKLWELMETGGNGLYPVMCHAVMSDISGGRTEEMQREDGYLLAWPDAEPGYSPGWQNPEPVNGPRRVYYMEMIPADSMEKLTLEEVLGEYTPGDVLEIYEELKAEEGYEEIYGEGYEEYAFSEAFFRCMGRGALEKKADLYAVTAEGIQRADGMAYAYAAGNPKDGGGTGVGVPAREEAAEKTVPEETAGDYAFLTHPQGRNGGSSEDYILLFVSLEDKAVEPGGNLWKIAEKNLGDGRRWQEIAQINGLSDPDLIFPEEKLIMPDLKYYMQKPAVQRGKGYYLSDEGAFRFQMPEGWPLMTCSLDSHLSTFMGEDSSVRVLWGIEDNGMGEDAWSEEWDSVCGNIEETARIVFGEDFRDIFFEKYGLEGGGEVYYICCAFTDEEGRGWMASAAYRFGKKNLMEFIGIGPAEHRLDIGRLTLYTAATYEEYGEERHMGFGEDGAVYKGMAVWQYPFLHNPFVVAYECTNGKTWHQKRELEEAEEDEVVEWQEPVLPAIIRKALGIEGDIRYSDLLEIERLEAIESVGYDYCSINEERFETDWKDIPNGDALLADIAQCRALYALRLQIGDISDFSPIGGLKLLEELEIQAGRTVKDVGFLDELEYLRQCVLETAPQQIFVDSLSDRLWERTCEEEGLTTFRKWYDGEPGKGFDEVEIPAP